MEQAVEYRGEERDYLDWVAGVVDGGHPSSSDRREHGVESREVGVGVGDDRGPRRLPPFRITPVPDPGLVHRQ
jgi:hypothetical protein